MWPVKPFIGASTVIGVLLASALAILRGGRALEDEGLHAHSPQ